MSTFEGRVELANSQAINLGLGRFSMSIDAEMFDAHIVLEDDEQIKKAFWSTGDNLCLVWHNVAFGCWQVEKILCGKIRKF